MSFEFFPENFNEIKEPTMVMELLETNLKQLKDTFTADQETRKLNIKVLSEITKTLAMSPKTKDYYPKLIAQREKSINIAKKLFTDETKNFRQIKKIFDKTLKKIIATRGSLSADEREKINGLTSRYIETRKNYFNNLGPLENFVNKQNIKLGKEKTIFRQEKTILKLSKSIDDLKGEEKIADPKKKSNIELKAEELGRKFDPTQTKLIKELELQRHRGSVASLGGFSAITASSILARIVGNSTANYISPQHKNNNVIGNQRQQNDDKKKDIIDEKNRKELNELKEDIDHLKDEIEHKKNRKHINRRSRRRRKKEDTVKAPINLINIINKI